VVVAVVAAAFFKFRFLEEFRSLPLAKDFPPVARHFFLSPCCGQQRMRVIPGNTGWCPAVAGSTFRLVVVVVVGPRAAPGRRRGFCRRVARTMPHAVRRLVLLLSVGWRHGRRGRTRPGFSSGAFSLRNVRLPGVSLRWWLLLLLLLSSSSPHVTSRHGTAQHPREHGAFGWMRHPCLVPSLVYTPGLVWGAHTFPNTGASLLNRPCRFH